MDILIESMAKFTFKPEAIRNPWHTFTIRLWRQESSYVPGDSTKSADAAKNAIEKANLSELTIYNIAEAVLKVDRMNAVEVLDELGNGCVVYKDWP